MQKIEVISAFISNPFIRMRMVLGESASINVRVCKINVYGWQGEEGVWRNQWAVRVEAPLPAVALPRADS